MLAIGVYMLVLGKHFGALYTKISACKLGSRLAFAPVSYAETERRWSMIVGKGDRMEANGDVTSTQAPRSVETLF